MGMLVTSGSDGLVLLMVKDRMPCCTEARMAETSASSGSDHERLKLPKRRSRCRDFWNSSPASCRFADIISAHDARLLRMTTEGKQAAVCTPVTHNKTSYCSSRADGSAHLAVSLTVRGANIYNSLLISWLGGSSLSSGSLAVP